MKKLLATLFVVAIIASGFAVSAASASTSRPGCNSYGFLHTGC
jgi:hypothetical protein